MNGANMPSGLAPINIANAKKHPTQGINANIFFHSFFNRVSATVVSRKLLLRYYSWSLAIRVNFVFRRQRREWPNPQR